MRSPKPITPYPSTEPPTKTAHVCAVLATHELALIVIFPKSDIRNPKFSPAPYPICTNPLSLRAAVNDSTSIGQTVTQMPHPIQQVLALFSSSCFRANCITSMPTWQFRLHSPQAMHLSLD